MRTFAFTLLQIFPFYVNHKNIFILWYIEFQIILSLGFIIASAYIFQLFAGLFIINLHIFYEFVNFL